MNARVALKREPSRWSAAAGAALERPWHSTGIASTDNFGREVEMSVTVCNELEPSTGEPRHAARVVGVRTQRWVLCGVGRGARWAHVHEVKFCYAVEYIVLKRCLGQILRWCILVIHGANGMPHLAQHGDQAVVSFAMVQYNNVVRFKSGSRGGRRLAPSCSARCTCA